MSEIFGDRETSVSPWTARAGVLAALLSSGCASQGIQIPVNEPSAVNMAPKSSNRPIINSLASVVRPTEPAKPEIPPGSMVITGSAPNSEPNPKAWPNVPATCVFTGVVLINDQYSKPHQILLENMCIQKRGGIKNIYEGKHKWVKADPKNHYKIPFRDAHLEEKPKCFAGRRRGSCLTFIAQNNETPVKDDLGNGLEPGTFTFAYSLDAYGVRPIVK